MTYTWGNPGRVETKAMRWPSGLYVGDKLSENLPTVKRCKQQLSFTLTVKMSVPSSVARLNASVLPSGENAGVKSRALPVENTGARLPVAMSCKNSWPCPDQNSM